MTELSFRKWKYKDNFHYHRSGWRRSDTHNLNADSSPAAAGGRAMLAPTGEKLLTELSFREWKYKDNFHYHRSGWRKSDTHNLNANSSRAAAGGRAMLAPTGGKIIDETVI